MQIKLIFTRKFCNFSLILKVRVFELGNGLSQKDSQLNLNFTHYIALEMRERNCESGSHITVSAGNSI